MVKESLIIERELLTREELAKRWNFKSVRAIEALEQNGTLKRVPAISVPRYSLRQIEELENAGLDLNPLSPVERKRLTKKIEALEIENQELKDKLNVVKMAVN